MNSTQSFYEFYVRHAVTLIDRVPRYYSAFWKASPTLK